jgi:hypothetical protein
VVSANAVAENDTTATAVSQSLIGFPFPFSLETK